jgi:hypothetical protein
MTVSVTNSLGGTITPATLTVVSGGSDTFTITPATGYYLSSLTDNNVNVTGSVNGDSYTITDVTAAHTIVATFAIYDYTVSASISSGNGSGSITPANSYVAYGSNVTLTINPAAGYYLSLLTDNGVNVTGSVNGGSYTITNVTSAHSVVATFSLVAASVASPAMGPWGFISAALGLGLALKRKKK